VFDAKAGEPRILEQGDDGPALTLGMPGTVWCWSSMRWGPEGERAARIVDFFAKLNRINPKLLVATLKKEQTLVSEHNQLSESDRRVYYAMGCGRNGGFPSDTFFIQIR